MDDQKEGSSKLLDFVKFFKRKRSGTEDPENDPDPSPVSPVASARVPKDSEANTTELKGKPLNSTPDEYKKAA